MFVPWHVTLGILPTGVKMLLHKVKTRNTHISYPLGALHELKLKPELKMGTYKVQPRQLIT